MATSPLAADLAAAVVTLPAPRRTEVAVDGDTVDVADTADSTDTCDDGGESACVSATSSTTRAGLDLLAVLIGVIAREMSLIAALSPAAASSPLAALLPVVALSPVAARSDSACGDVLGTV
jgi:hypothetical protein